MPKPTAAGHWRRGCQRQAASLHLLRKQNKTFLNIASAPLKRANIGLILHIGSCLRAPPACWARWPCLFWFFEKCQQIFLAWLGLCAVTYIATKFNCTIRVQLHPKKVHFKATHKRCFAKRKLQKTQLFKIRTYLVENWRQLNATKQWQLPTNTQHNKPTWRPRTGLFTTWSDLFW